jgi:redox-sensing transcriptional repressor
VDTASYQVGASERAENLVPGSTVTRLPDYLRALTALTALDVDTVSSSDLADLSGVTSAILRKDLSHLGSFGTRGVGYDVPALAQAISGALGLGQTHRLAIIGIGNLGHALANYSGYVRRGFEVVALLDTASSVVGTRTDGGMLIEHVAHLERVFEREAVTMAVLALPGPSAQAVAERVVATGVREILSFAPIALSLPADVTVRSVDVAGELQILAFHAAARDGGTDGGTDGGEDGGTDQAVSDL